MEYLFLHKICGIMEDASINEEVTIMAMKAVLFDLDNTLFDFATAHKQSLIALAEYGESRFDVPARRFLLAYQQADRQLKQEQPLVAACHNRIIIAQRMLELLGLPSIVTPLELYETYWGTMLRSIKPRDGAVELLSRLHHQRIRTGICTDMTAHIQHRKIAALGLAGYLDAMVTSEEAGVEKPNPKIFLDCLNKLNVKPNEAVFIGDSFERDVCGAHAAGLIPFWLNVAGAKAPKVNFPYKELHSLKEIL